MAGRTPYYQNWDEVKQRLAFLEDEYRLLNKQIKSLRRKLAEHLTPPEHKKI